MNFSFFVLEFLKKHGRVTLPGFGTFALKLTNATFDREGKNILPPGAELVFDAEDDHAAHSFAAYLAQRRSITPAEAELEIRKQIDYWNAALEKNHTVSIEDLGTFTMHDSQLHFKGANVGNLSPAFFGLEEINLSAVKKGNKQPYRFKSILTWSAVVLIIGLAIAYFGVMQPELLFGKASFESQPLPKESTVAKSDSIINPVIATDRALFLTDSLRNDSLNAAIPAATKTSKTYSKPKWKKSKKRRSH